MKMTRFQYLIFVAFSLLILLVSVACGSSDDNPDGDIDGDQETDGDDPASADNLIEQGKRYLAAGESQAAYDTFRVASINYPENSQATFGYCLATLQNWMGLIDTGIGLVAGDEQYLEPVQVSGAGSSVQKSGAFKAEDGSGGPPELASNIIQSLRAEMEDQITRLDSLKQLEEFTFTLESYPVIFRQKEYMNLHSEWDLADVHFLSAITNMVYSVIVLMDSQQIDFKFGDIGSEINEENPDPLALLVELFDKDTELLTIRGAEGLAAWTRSKASLTTSVADARQAFRLMAVETDKQSDDVMVQNDSLTVKRVEHFAMQGSFNTGTTKVSLLWNGEDLSVMNTLDRMIEHLDGKDDTRLRLETDLMMMMGVFADFLRKAIGFEDLLSLMGIEGIDSSILQLVDSVGQDNGEALPAMLIGFLPMAGIPADTIQLDVNTFYSRPYPFREFIGNIGTNPFDGRYAFLKSFECARLGFDFESFTPGDALPILLHDRGPVGDATEGAANDTAAITLYSILIPTEEQSGEPVVLDREPVTLTEDDVIVGFFGGSLATAQATQAQIVQEDGMLQIPDGTTVVARYSDENGEEAILIESTIDPNGLADIFFYDMDCQPDSGRDYDHFAQPEFVDAYYIPDPPAEISHETPYPFSAPDGIAGDQAYIPWKSASYNGLLWLDMGNIVKGDVTEYGFVEGFKMADPRMTNAMQQKIMSSASSMGGM